MQIETLRTADVDLVSAMTFNNIPEAVGVAKAAASAGLPLSLSFMVDPAGRLLTGPSLREAVQAVDERAGDARPDFYGINCSHPIEFEPAFAAGGPWLERVRSLRRTRHLPTSRRCARSGTSRPAIPPRSAPIWARSRSAIRTSICGAGAAGPGMTTSAPSPSACVRSNPLTEGDPVLRAT